MTTVEVTTFEDAQVTPGYETPMLNNSTRLSNLESTHSIIEFLRRPALMKEMEFKSGDIKPLLSTPYDGTMQTPLYTANFPFDLTKLGGKADKINKFEYIKSDVMVKLTINANNMTSGRFWLTYAPIDNFVAPEYQISAKHRAGVTSYPGVEMDIQINNSVEMRIPYLHWAEAMSTTDASKQESSMASLHLFALTNLRSQGDYGITIQVWGWFDNITLVGPTVNKIKADATSEEDNAGRMFMKLKKKHAAEYERIVAMMQVGRETKGPISQVAAAVSTIAAQCARIPLISEVAATVGWIADLVGGVASFFGWSKPVNGSVEQRFVNIPAYGYTNAEGQDAATVLGLTPRNELALPVDTFTTDVDEMDIEYICRNPAVVNSSPWVTTDPSLYSLLTLKVAPYADMTAISQQTLKEVRSVASCDFVASLFSMWRGVMCYRIAVVKTAYHTGRLEISFVPNLGKATMSDKDDTTNTYRYILDITNESEVVIKIPFFSESYMLDIGAHDSNAIGTLTVRPITKLHCPDQVSNTVDILVWKWMEEPIFAFPISAQVTPYVNKATPRVRRQALPAPPERIKAEIQIIVANVQESKTISFFEGVDIKKTKVDILGTVSGEACENLRYLTRSSQLVTSITIPATAGNSDASTSSQSVYDCSGGNDYISYISFLYRYMRGGVNVKLFHNQNNETGNRLGGRIRTNLAYGANTSRRSPEHLTYLILNPVHEVSVPFYSKYKRIPTIPIPDEVAVGRVKMPLLTISNERAISTTLDIYRSGKDDFSFGTLVGPPMLQKI